MEYVYDNYLPCNQISWCDASENVQAEDWPPKEFKMSQPARLPWQVFLAKILAFASPHQLVHSTLLALTVCRHVWLYCICRLLELASHSSDVLGVSFWSRTSSNVTWVKLCLKVGGNTINGPHTNDTCSSVNDSSLHEAQGRCSRSCNGVGEDVGICDTDLGASNSTWNQIEKRRGWGAYHQPYKVCELAMFYDLSNLFIENLQRKFIQYSHRS